MFFCYLCYIKSRICGPVREETKQIPYNMRRILTFYIMMLAAFPLLADDAQWCIVTDGGGQIELSKVGFLLTSDYDDSFSIVCNDGNVYSGISSVSFEQVEVSGISYPKASSEIEIDMDARQLTITGCKEGTTAILYTSDGRQLLRKSISGSDNTVPVGNLPSGVYILKAGDTSVKFIKR